MNRRNIVRTGVRAAIGVVTLAIGAGVVAGATLLPLPNESETPAGRVVTPVALDQQRVCSGSLLQLAGDSGASATTVSAVGQAATVTGTGSGEAPTTEKLKGADDSKSSPSLVTAPASGTTVPLVAGAQSQTVASSSLSGFAAAPCAEPTSSTWLVGGSTETGRTTLLVLVNPTDVNSTVDLSLFGENGIVDGPGLKGIVVAPRSQKVVPLAGFATGLASPTVHVTSRGGQIAANLQENVVRTLQPGGTDVISAAAAPSKTVSVPGIAVRDGDAIQSALGQDGFDDLKTILRAYVPGDKTAQLSVQVSTSSGTGATFSVTAQGGRVTDVPLDGLPDGRYTATVTSDQPLVAGVRTSSITKDGAADVAWVGSAPALHGTTMFAAPAGDRPALTLSNPTSKSITSTLTSTGSGRSDSSAKKSTQKITVAANSSETQTIGAGALLTLSGADGLHAAVGYDASAAIAGWSLFSPAAVSETVTVYP